MVNSFKEKAEAGEEFFKNMFKKPTWCNTQEIPEVINLFPRMIDEEMNILLKAEVTEEELEKVVYSYQKGKILGPDGLTIEFFQGFYDLVKEYLLKIVQESQRARKVLGALNSTFLALIPKKQNPTSFEEFRPISCWNVVYKLIAKTISLILKPILSKVITQEQFGFLENRQIHNAVSLAQETIHTIKLSKNPSFSLKLDLYKAYDRVN